MLCREALLVDQGAEPACTLMVPPTLFFSNRSCHLPWQTSATQTVVRTAYVRRHPTGVPLAREHSAVFFSQRLAFLSLCAKLPRPIPVPCFAKCVPSLRHGAVLCVLMPVRCVYSMQQYNRAVCRVQYGSWPFRKDISAELLKHGLGVVYRQVRQKLSGFRRS